MYDSAQKQWDDMVESYQDIIDDYAAKIQYMVNFMEGCGILEDACFTFPDGDTWTANG